MITVNFTYDSETKNKFKYQETPDTNYVGTLYLSKLAFSGKKPDKIEVTIKEKE